MEQGMGKNRGNQLTELEIAIAKQKAGGQLTPREEKILDERMQDELEDKERERKMRGESIN